MPRNFICLEITEIQEIALEAKIATGHANSNYFLLCKEMLEYMAPIVGNPGEYWNYRDESFVGFWAGANHRRGGASGVATTVLNFE